MADIKLPSGREFDANLSIVGIDDEGSVYEGYDGSLEFGDYTKWPEEDLQALADLMIDRWTAFKNKERRS